MPWLITSLFFALLFFSGCISKTNINEAANSPLLSSNQEDNAGEKENLAFTSNSPNSTPFTKNNESDAVGEEIRNNPIPLEDYSFNNQAIYNSNERISTRIDILENLFPVILLDTFLKPVFMEESDTENRGFIDSLKTVLQKTNPDDPSGNQLQFDGIQSQLLDNSRRIDYGKYINIRKIVNEQEVQDIHFQGLNGYIHFPIDYQSTNGKISYGKLSWTAPINVDLARDKSCGFSITGMSFLLEISEGKEELFISFEPDAKIDLWNNDQHGTLIIQGLNGTYNIDSLGNISPEISQEINLKLQNFFIPPQLLNAMTWIPGSFRQIKGIEGEFSWFPEKGYGLNKQLPGPLFANWFFAANTIKDLALTITPYPENTIFNLNQIDKLVLNSQELTLTGHEQIRKIYNGIIHLTTFYKNTENDRTINLAFEDGVLQASGELREYNGNNFSIIKEDNGLSIEGKNIPFSDGSTANYKAYYETVEEVLKKRSFFQFMDSENRSFAIVELQGTPHGSRKGEILSESSRELPKIFHLDSQNNFTFLDPFGTTTHTLSSFF
ncbi:hypothetical protein ACFL35_17100 [Candidatus Riflebacteria bacterium]